MFKRLLVIGCFAVLAAACATAPANPDAVPNAGAAAAPETPAEGVADEEHASDEAGQDDEADHDDEDHRDEDHDEEHERRELGAHEHGAAELTIAIVGGEIAIDLQTPAFNVLGFEYAPVSEEEKTLLSESVAALAAGNLLQLDPSAGCTLVEADVDSELLGDDHGDEEHADEDHGDEVHNDMTAAYLFICEQGDEVRSLDASPLFARFPNFEAIRVQWLSETQQSAATLSPEEPVLSFE